jgi:fatty-acyl-CoA synthase
MTQTPTPAHFRFWPPHLSHTLHAPQTSLVDNLRVSAMRYPDKPAVVFFNHVMTYGELGHQVDAMAAYLQSLGVVAGERVLLMMQNSPQWVVAHFAILRANAVVVPVNPMNRAHELSHYISDAQAKVAVVSADLAGFMAQADAGLPAGEQLQHVVVAHLGDVLDPNSEGFAQEVPQAWAAWLSTPVAPPVWAQAHNHTWAQAVTCTAEPSALCTGPADLAVLPYTSGTTGLPKGCVHTHASIMHNAVASSYWGSSTADAVSLIVVPMFHITGMVSGMHGAVFGGATMVVMPRWDRDLAGRMISRWRVTHWTNIPTMIMDLLASPNMGSYDLSSLKYIGGGGAAMPQAVAQRLFDEFGLRFAEGYGLTETAAPSHSNPPLATKQQCLGVPFVGARSIVVDPETLQPLPVGEAGEILINGPMVFQGYWRRPDATAEAFVEIDGVRYFRSGDLGRMDEDGYYFMTDRLKRMINASGFKVWPAEVEALMFKHPAVAEACVIGVPDAYRGETVKALVVLRLGHDVTEQDMLQWCHDEMAVYKAPRIIEFVAALPKSGSGKVMWRALQDEAKAAAVATKPAA